MAKKKPLFPDVIYVTKETDPRDKSFTWLVAEEVIPAESDDWQPFAAYKRVGVGRSRRVVENKIEMNEK